MPGSMNLGVALVAFTPWASCRGVVCSRCLLRVNTVIRGFGEREKRSVSFQSLNYLFVVMSLRHKNGE